MEKQPKISRKLRRGLAEFKPQYNGKAPISFAEYIAGFKNEKLVPRRLRNHPLNKAVTE
ncbi:hypothetical protein [Lysinibacillus sp. TE18511]